MLINARHSLGLTTRLNTSKLGDHSLLSANTVDRVRKLAGSFTEGLQSGLGAKIGSDHVLWTWAARHASWVLNRFQPVKGATPYEIVHGKSYKGLLAEYGEAVHGYIKSLNKGEARRRLSLFFGKSGKARYRCFDRWCAISAKQVHQEDRSGLVQALGNLQKVQCLFTGTSDKLWR